MVSSGLLDQRKKLLKLCSSPLAGTVRGRTGRLLEPARSPHLLEVAGEVLRKGGDYMHLRLTPLTLLVLEVAAIMKYESGKAEKPSPATS